MSCLRSASLRVFGGGNTLTMAATLGSKVGLGLGLVVVRVVVGGWVVISPNSFRSLRSLISPISSVAFCLAMAASIALICLAISSSEMMINCCFLASSGVWAGGSALAIVATLGSRVVVCANVVGVKSGGIGIGMADSVNVGAIGSVGIGVIGSADVAGGE